MGGVKKIPIIEIPCNAGDTVFADLRISQSKKPKHDDLTECTVSVIEIDRMWDEPLFTVVRKEFNVCHLHESDFGKFWASEFGENVFTKEQYFDMKA